MKRILILLVLFFVVRHFAAPTTHLSRFLAEGTAVEPTTAETSHAEHGAESIEKEEEGGFELHYSFGTKGFYVCIVI